MVLWYVLIENLSGATLSPLRNFFIGQNQNGRRATLSRWLNTITLLLFVIED